MYGRRYQSVNIFVDGSVWARLPIVMGMPQAKMLFSTLELETARSSIDVEIVAEGVYLRVPAVCQHLLSCKHISRKAANRWAPIRIIH